MGAFCNSIHIRSDNARSVRRVAEAIRDGTGISFYLGPRLNGWVGVYPSLPSAEVVRFFTERVKAPIFHFMVHDSDVFTYTYHERSQCLDTYNSRPGYFGEPAPGGTGGNPGSFASLLTGDEAVVRATEILASADAYVFAEEQLRDFAELLGIANAATSYQAIEVDDTEDLESAHRIVMVEGDGDGSSPILDLEPAEEELDLGLLASDVDLSSAALEQFASQLAPEMIQAARDMLDQLTQAPGEPEPLFADELAARGVELGALAPVSAGFMTSGVCCLAAAGGDSGFFLYDPAQQEADGQGVPLYYVEPPDFEIGPTSIVMPERVMRLSASGGLLLAIAHKNVYSRLERVCAWVIEEETPLDLKLEAANIQRVVLAGENIVGICADRVLCHHRGKTITRKLDGVHACAVHPHRPLLLVADHQLLLTDLTASGRRGDRQVQLPEAPSDPTGAGHRYEQDRRDRARADLARTHQLFPRIGDRAPDSQDGALDPHQIIPDLPVAPSLLHLEFSTNGQRLYAIWDWELQAIPWASVEAGEPVPAWRLPSARLWQEHDVFNHILEIPGTPLLLVWGCHGSLAWVDTATREFGCFDGLPETPLYIQAFSDDAAWAAFGVSGTNRAGLGVRALVFAPVTALLERRQTTGIF